MDQPNLNPVGSGAALEALATERLRTLSLCRALRHDFDSIVEASRSSNADDEHDPEGATVAFERAQVKALLAQSESRLIDIDVALQRCRQGRYGTCDSCGETIAAERLAALPAASTCIRCAI